MPSAIRVALADTPRLNLEGMAAMLDRAADIEVVGLTTDPHALVQLVKEVQPDLLVAHAGILRLVGHQSPSKVIALVDEDPATAPEAMGVVTRTNSGTSLLEAIRAVAAGRKWRVDGKPKSRRGMGLSPREHDIVKLVATGCSNRDIAQRLGLSEQSVKNLVSRILKKKGYTNRVQIAMEAWVVPKGA